MKKTLTILLAVLMAAAVISIPVIADTQTTTLTTTVPEAEYTMTVPEAGVIPYNASEFVIGNVKVQAISGFTEGKNVRVKITHDDLSSEDVETTIPYTLTAGAANTGYTHEANFSSGYVTFYGGSEVRNSSGQAYYNTPVGQSTAKSYYTHYSVAAHFNSNDWAKALAGDYSTTLTFVSEVVIEK